MKTDLEQWKTNLEPWKTIKTNLNHWKPIKTEMEPWKTNLELSKLTWSCRGWLWGVQVVTGNSQEEVMIFRDTQTDKHFIIIYISPSSSPWSSSQLIFLSSNLSLHFYNRISQGVWSQYPHKVFEDIGTRSPNIAHISSFLWLWLWPAPN